MLGESLPYYYTKGVLFGEREHGVIYEIHIKIKSLTYLTI